MRVWFGSLLGNNWIGSDGTFNLGLRCVQRNILVDRCRLGGCLVERSWRWRKWCSVDFSKTKKGDGKLGIGWYAFENRAIVWLAKRWM
jgi:hypothetical protein